MPYIKFPAMPGSTAGRTVANAYTDPVSGAYVCEVEACIDGDVEITDAEYGKVQEAAIAAYEAYVTEPAPAPEPEPSIADQVAAMQAQLAALLAKVE